MNMNLTKQMALILAFFVIAAAICAFVPAYLTIRNELVEQTNQRLHEGVQYTGAILRYDQEHLQNSIILAAQRPTLLRLMRDVNIEELAVYLSTFQNSALLDHLFVTDTAGELLAGKPYPQGALTLSFTAPVGSAGFVSGGVLLDEAFAARLGEQTGFQYVFQASAEAAPVLRESADGVVYYQDNLPLGEFTERPDSTLSVILPVTGLLAVEGRVIGALLFMTLAVALLASLVGGYYIRARIRPLRLLTLAARELGQGELDKPVTTDSTTPEILMLAEVLEHSRKQLQQTLKELLLEKEWSEALIQSINEGIITLDQDGAVRFFSEGASQITQIAAGTALGKRIDELLLTTVGSPFTEFMPQPGGRRSVIVHRPKGDSITMMVTRARQTDNEPITIVIHDITEETQRRRLQTYFLANVSHEFRTPLAGMKVSLELMLENAHYLTASELDELLNSLHLSVSSLQYLIDNLLESSRIEANHLSLRRQSLHVNAIMSEALRLIQPFLKRRRQRIALEQPFALPTINADATRLTQVLVNLLSNASKYSPMKSPIDILIEMREGALYVAIADRGEGIPDDQRETIFQQFVRLGHEAKSDYSAGLGLAVVKAVIEAHSGQVGVDHRAGGGAIFWFTLPLEGAELYERARG